MRKNIKFHAIYIRNVSKSLRNFCAKILIGNPTFIAMYEEKGLEKMLYIITISLIKNPTLKTGLFIKKSFDKGTFLVDEHELEEQFSSSHLDKHCTMWRLQITRTADEGCMVILVTGVPPLPLQLASHTL